MWTMCEDETTMSLSDKIGDFDCEKVDNNLLWSEDVKKAVQELKEMNGCNSERTIVIQNNDLDKIIDQIFGPKLVEAGK